MIDSWTDMWVGISMNNATYAYKSDFIFNDSRLEGVDSEKGQVADMITDLRLNGSESEFYHTTKSPISDIAGHSDVYDFVFSDEQQKNPISIYDTFRINSILFSHAKMFIPLVFTYATTMLGLSLACYTLFQTLDNERVRAIRRWKVYTRFKMYIWHIMILLAVLAIMTLLEIFTFGKLLSWIGAWILLGVPLFLSVLTLSALVYWIGLLIRYFDAEKERKNA